MKTEPLPVIEETASIKETTPASTPKSSVKGLNFAEYMDQMKSKPEEEKDPGPSFAAFMDEMNS